MTSTSYITGQGVGDPRIAWAFAGYGAASKKLEYAALGEHTATNGEPKCAIDEVMLPEAVDCHAPPLTRLQSAPP